MVVCLCAFIHMDSFTMKSLPDCMGSSCKLDGAEKLLGGVFGREDENI